MKPLESFLRNCFCFTIREIKNKEDVRLALRELLEFRKKALKEYENIKKELPDNIKRAFKSYLFELDLYLEELIENYQDLFLLEDILEIRKIKSLENKILSSVKKVIRSKKRVT